MSIDPIIEHLAVLKQRLQQAKGDDVRRIAGVDLYHLSDSRVKNAWERRIGYYKKLSQDATFLGIEDTAKDTAKNLASLALTLSKKLSPQWDKNFSDWLYPPRRYDPWEDEATLAEKLIFYLDEENYYSIRQLNDGPDLCGYPMDNGMYHNCNKILEQHLQLYKHCQRFGDASRKLGTKKQQEKYVELFQKLSGLLDELEFHLVHEPRKLHLGYFEKVQLAGSAFDHTILGGFTKGFESAHGNYEDEKTEDIRKAAIDVCEELALEVALYPLQSVEGSIEDRKKEPIEDHGLKIWPLRQEVECDGIKVTLKGKSWGIVEKCITNDGWATDCGTRGKIDVDSDVKDLNAPWKRTGWKIAKHCGKKIILGKEKKRKNPSRNNPEAPPKIPRKLPVKTD
ncbi:MAG: hypothetical protein Greene041662_1013 [Candidatus Peregrinibacteria bacterium Greene0416_62]|nr:MAG: hypothetical protein Greene041662_1013 [Candidatus Peregrinibacteria bacterium Greene0416_62]